MAKKKTKKMTDAQIAALKNRLWAWAMSQDMSDVLELYIYDQLHKDLAKTQKQAPPTLFNFEASAEDAATIFNEVENSCLSEELKKKILGIRGS